MLRGLLVSPNAHHMCCCWWPCQANTSTAWASPIPKRTALLRGLCCISPMPFWWVCWGHWCHCLEMLLSGQGYAPDLHSIHKKYCWFTIHASAKAIDTTKIAEIPNRWLVWFAWNMRSKDNGGASMKGVHMHVVVHNCRVYRHWSYVCNVATTLSWVLMLYAETNVSRRGGLLSPQFQRPFFGVGSWTLIAPPLWTGRDVIG